MANPIAVAVVDSLDDLSEDLSSLDLVEVFPVDDAIEKLTARADSGERRVLQDEVDILAVFEGVVEPEDVGMFLGEVDLRGSSLCPPLP